ncbi:MAG TPA: hypothetical protein VMD47_04995 [Candidatus Acidoferrales bacterium]|nr:hypothetical protein [Candidatus Acidoferrales bacterium]
MIVLAAALLALGPPVVATSCTGGVTSIELTEHASYTATFRNTANVAADDIHVAIPYGRRRVANFDVKQTFPPDASVAVHMQKYLAGGLYAYSTTQNACKVEYVHFIDGTIWGNPSFALRQAQDDRELRMTGSSG